MNALVIHYSLETGDLGFMYLARIYSHLRTFAEVNDV